MPHGAGHKDLLAFGIAAVGCLAQREAAVDHIAVGFIQVAIAILRQLFQGFAHGFAAIVAIALHIGGDIAQLQMIGVGRTGEIIASKQMHHAVVGCGHQKFLAAAHAVADGAYGAVENIAQIALVGAGVAHAVGLAVFFIGGVCLYGGIGLGSGAPCPRQQRVLPFFIVGGAAAADGKIAVGQIGEVGYFFHLVFGAQ